MSVYSYTTDSIEIFEDPIVYGLLTEIPAETIDAGNISVSANSTEINGYIVNTQTVYPFGSAKVFGNSNAYFVKNPDIEKATLKLSGTITEGIRFIWVGSGTLFEIGGGQERIIAPWVGSSGPLRFVGLSINNKSISYNEFVTNIFTADDFGLISSAVSSYQDFGTVSITEFDAGSENYGLITSTNTETSFSTSFGIKGSAQQIFKACFNKIGEGIVTVSGESTSEFIPSYDAFGLFNISGGDRYTATFNNVSTATIITIGSKQEIAVFDYNTTSNQSYNEEDFQFITSVGSTENYGLVSLPLDAGIDSYGYITNLLTENPFGTLTLSGNFSPKLRNSFFGSGSISINGNTNIVFAEPIPQIYKYTETALFNISGTATTALQSEFTYFGSGYLLNIGGSTLARTWSYTLNSSVEFEIDNYGSITQSGTTTDYGLVSLVLDSGIDSYGYISNLTTEIPFGTFALAGNVTSKRNNSFIGSGSKSIYGSSTVVFAEPISQTYRYTESALYNISGSATTSFQSKSTYSGSGSLFNIGTSISSRTWNYTLESEVEFAVDNYGSITTSGTVVDYGLVSLPPLDSVVDSYGYITNLIAERPFGFVGIFNGSAIQKYTPAYIEIGKGSITLLGDSSSEFIPSYDSFGLFNISGDSRNSSTIRNIFTGVVFTVGSKQESTTFDYNISSIVTYSEEDFEFITSIGSTEDYGLVTLPLDAGIDSYGYISNLTTEYAFGSVGRLSGSVDDQYKPSFAQIGQAFINISGNSSHQYVPSYDSVGLFNITGGDRYSTTINNISTAVIFTIGSKQETAVFDYNINSVVTYSEEDFEFITSNGSIENYGSIALPLDAGIDSYGYIANLTTEYPFGFVGSLGGSAIQKYKPTFVQIGQGSINVSGESSHQYVPSYDSVGLFNITGGDRYSTTIINTSAGVLLSFGSKQENAVFDYNTNSIVSYTEEDFQFITSIGSNENYGSIVLPLDAGIDSYGYITNLTTEYPFGSVGSFSGHGVEEYEPIFGQVGQGSIIISGESSHQYIPSYDSFGLFDITGDSKYSSTFRNIFSIELFTTGSLIKESTSFHYNLNSVVSYSEEDYEFITSVGLTEDYGSITVPFDNGVDSYGYIGNLTTEYPFGSIGSLGGHGVEEYEPIYSQIGEGFINISGESSTQYIPSYDSFGLFNINGGEIYSASFSNKSTITLFAIGSKEESATFDYNISSIVPYTEEDFEFITTSGSVEDYGSIAIVFDDGLDSYGYITNLTTEYSFGFIGTLNGSADDQYKPSYSQVGEAFINISGESQTQFIPSYDSFGLFNISGGDRYSTSFNNISTAVIFTVGSKQETAVFDYNTTSVVTYSEEDYQFITSIGSTDDYGLVTLPLDAGIDSYGYISNLTTEYPFGSIGSISGSVQQSFNKGLYTASGSLFALNGVADSTSSNPPESTVLFTLSGSGGEILITQSFAGSGSLFTVGSKKEIAIFDYNTSSIVTYSEEDFEFITSVGLTEDYGLVTLPLDAGVDSYGYITNLTTEYPFGSIGSLGGHGIEEYEPIFGQIGEGSIIISGESSTNYIPSYGSFGLFNISGGERYSTTVINISTATLFAIGSREESAVFNYTVNSIELFAQEDYEFITSPGIIEDYGSLELNVHSIAEHYGYITNLTTEYPFGSIGSIGGHAEEMFDPAFAQVGQAFINISGESSHQYIPSYDSFGLFNISGGDRYSITIINTSAGVLLSFGSKQESAVFDYTTTSIATYSEEDYQFITSSGLAEDYGSVALPLDAGIDSYGYIGNLTTEYPFGSIGFFSGSGEQSFTNGVYTTSGSLFALNGVADSTTANPPESTALFTLTGSSDVILITKSYAGSGSLFAVGSKQETAVFDYNTTSVVTYSEEDFEFITSIGSNENYGSVALPLDAGIDSYGYITNLTTEYPFGFIGRFNGSAKQSFSEGLYTASGSLFALNGVAEATRSNPPESTALFTFNGSVIESNTESYVGSGSLFTVGSKQELAVFDYNISSIVTYSEEDYEFITSIGSTEDYGSVALSLDSGIDSYGYITEATTNYPFGSIGSIGGHAEEMFDPAFAEVGFAQINISGEALTNFVPTYESFGLFNISGGERYSTTIINISTATIFAIGSREESAVFDYNVNSVVYYTEDDYEFITSVGITEDYGSVALPLDAGIDSYGYIVNLTTSYPFGSIGSISGSVQQSFNKGLYTASGSLFALNGAAESTRSNPPESTALFTLFGRSLESFGRASHVATGTLTYSGSMTGMKFIVSNPVGGTIFVSGSTKQAFAEGLYTGSGSLFTFTGASESVGANPPESTALFNVFGGLRESFTEGNYNASGTLTYSGFASEIKFIISNPVGGTLFVSGSAIQRQGDAYTGSGSLFGYTGAAESKTVDIPEFFGLFNIGGSVKESFTESNYDGSGSVSISGFADNIKFSSGNIGSGFIYASGAVSDIKLSYGNVGSGSLFGYTGAAESKTVDIPEFFGLFNVSGSKFEAYAKAPYIGSGSIDVIGQLLSEKHTESYVGSGDTALSGISDTRFVPNWNAFGSLFGYGGAAESKTVDIPEFFGLFNVSGSKFESYSKAPYIGSGSTTATGTTVERNTESYVGSGNASISGNAKFVVVPNNVGSGSAFVYGNGIEKQSDSYIGSGTLFGIFGSTESFTVNLQFTTLFSIFGKATESNTENYVGVGAAAFGSSSKELFTPNNIGSGSLFGIGGASESYAIAERSSGLFEISGSKVEKSSSAFVSDGQLSIISGIATESHTEVYIASGSTSINGSSVNKFSPSIIGSGFVYTNGSATERQLDNYVGFGSLFGFTGVVESIAVSPDDTFGLFNIFGSATEKNTESYAAFGNTTISGNAKSWFIPNNVGSGSQYISGFAIEKQTDNYVGTGNLFTFYGAQESATVNPDENVVLFRFSGTSIERNTESYVGFGINTISGKAKVHFVPNWNGSGSINITGFGKESHTEIYIGYGIQTISGIATEINKIARYQGYAEINISGNITEKQSNAYVGSGSLFDISGSESSVSFNPPESTSLFVFEGSSTSSSRKQYTGFGSIFEFNGSAESATKTTEATGLFEINGSATVVFPRKYLGSGSLFAISGSSESITYNLPEFNGLYSITGYGLSSVTSNPPENTAQYIVSGNVSDIKLSHSNKGFGSLFGINGASVVATPSYITEKIDGIKILGYAKESYARSSYIASGTEHITGSAESKYRFYEPAFTYVIII